MAAVQQRGLNPSRPLSIDRDAFFASLEQSFAVRLIQTERPNIQTCRIDEGLCRVISAEQLADFDYVPVVEDSEIVGLLNRAKAEKEARTADEVVRHCFRRLHPSYLISENAPLLDFIASANKEPCQLLVGRRGISGLVTISDMQKLPVQTALFSLIVHFEHVVSEKLRAANTDMEIIRGSLANRYNAIRKQLDRLQEQDLALDAVSALTLSDKLRLARVLGLVDLSDEQAEGVRWLRNSLAHGHEYASTRANVRRLVRHVRDLRAFLGSQSSA